jgi:hypothetical protein
MILARAIVALLSLALGLGGFLFYVVAWHEYVRAIVWLGVAVLVAELVRPDALAIVRHIEAAESERE